MLGWHMNPLTCGVARFNQQLAARLGVPYARLTHSCRYPLVSLKWSEIPTDPPDRLPMLIAAPQFDLFWHDAGEPTLTARATRTFYATETGCPSTIQGTASRAALNLLTFGMAHKFSVAHFERLRAVLAAYGRAYTVSLSTGIHEGTPWDAGFHANVALMRGIFGDQLRVLGFLGDDALARELQDCTAVALFYDPALRANNTTAWAALEAGAPLITNLDAQSPPELEHGVHCFDLARLTAWPVGEDLERFSRSAARRVAQRYSWDALLERLA